MPPPQSLPNFALSFLNSTNTLRASWDALPNTNGIEFGFVFTNIPRNQPVPEINIITEGPRQVAVFQTQVEVGDLWTVEGVLASGNTPVQTLRITAPLRNPLASARGLSIDASWDPPAGLQVDSYRTTLLGAAFTPAPPAIQPTISIDSGHIRYSATPRPGRWTLLVEPVVAGIRGSTTTFPNVVLLDPKLTTLLARLNSARTADGTITITPTLVDNAELASMFALLGVPNQIVIVKQADVINAGANLQVTGLLDNVPFVSKTPGPTLTEKDNVGFFAFDDAVLVAVTCPRIEAKTIGALRPLGLMPPAGTIPAWQDQIPIRPVANLLQVFRRIEVKDRDADNNPFVLTLPNIPGLSIRLGPLRPQIRKILAPTSKFEAVLVGDLSLQVGTRAVKLGQLLIDLLAPDTETVIAGTLQSTSVSVQDTVMALAESLPAGAPAGFVFPAAIASARVRVNLTKQNILLAGTFQSAASNSLYGRVAVLIQRIPPNDPVRFRVMIGAELRAATPASISGSFAPALTDLQIGVDLTSAAIVFTDIDGLTVQDFSDGLQGVPPGLSIKPGLNLFARLDFSAQNAVLLRSLRQVFSITATAGLTLVARIPADSSGPLELIARLDELKFSIGDLNATPFRDVMLKYSISAPSGDPPKRTHRLQLIGAIVVGFKIGATDRTFSFVGSMDVQADRVFCSIQTDDEISPLGIPGIVLKRIALSFEATTAANSATQTRLLLSARVEIGSFALKASMLLVQKSVQVVLIELKNADIETDQGAELSAKALFEKVDPNSFPVTIDITFKSGSLSWAPADVQVGGRDFAKGLTGKVVAEISGCEVDLSVNLQKTDTQTTLTAEGSLAAPIGSGFFQITGRARDGRGSMGPKVQISVDKTSSSAELLAGLRLFQSNVSDISVKIADKKISGTFAVPGDAGVLGGTSLTFIWDEQTRKLRIKDWKLPKLDINLPRFKSRGACSNDMGEGLKLDDPWKVDVDFAPSGQGFRATLTMTYDMNLLFGSAPPFLTFTLDIPAGDTLSWNALGDQIVSSITSQAEDIADQLAQNPFAFVQVIGVKLAKIAFSETLAYLECKAPDLAKNAMRTMLSEFAGEVGLWGAAAAGVAVGGAIGGRPGQLIEGAPPPARPNTPVLTQNGDHLTVSWAGSNNDNVTEFQVAVTVSQTNSPLPVQTVSYMAFSAVVPVPLSVMSGGVPVAPTVRVRVTAVGMGTPGQTSDESVLALSPNLRLRAEFHQGLLTTSLNVVPGEGESDVFEVIHRSTNTRLIPFPLFVPNPDRHGATALLDFTAPAGQLVPFRVRVIRTTPTDMSLLQADVDAVALDAPLAFAFSDDEETIRIQVVQQSGLSYLFEQQNAQGTFQRVAGLTERSSGGNLFVTFERLTTPSAQFRVRAFDALNSASPPVTINVPLPTPRLQQLDFDETSGAVLASWTPFAGATFEVTLELLPNPEIFPPVTTTVSTNSTAIPLGNAPLDRFYRLTVTTIAGALRSVPVRLTIMPQLSRQAPLPAGFVLANRLGSDLPQLLGPVTNRTVAGNNQLFETLLLDPVPGAPDTVVAELSVGGQAAPLGFIFVSTSQPLTALALIDLAGQSTGLVSSWSQASKWTAGVSTEPLRVGGTFFYRIDLQRTLLRGRFLRMTARRPGTQASFFAPLHVFGAPPEVQTGNVVVAESPTAFLRQLLGPDVAATSVAPAAFKLSAHAISPGVRIDFDRPVAAQAIRFVLVGAQGFAELNFFTPDEASPRAIIANVWQEGQWVLLTPNPGTFTFPIRSGFTVEGLSFVRATISAGVRLSGMLVNHLSSAGIIAMK